MHPVRIIDTEVNLIAEIDDYESLIWTRRWHKPGNFELHIDARKQHVGELQKGRLLLAGDKTGIILHRELKQGAQGEEQVLVKGASLASVLGRRITVPPTGFGYDRVNDFAETIMKGYVVRNCVIPTDTRREIPSLAVADDQERGAKTVYQTRYKDLAEELEKLSLISGLGWDVTLDWVSKCWVFDVLEGRDLIEGQTANPPVIFSADFDAIESQTFIDSDVGHKNAAYVGGQGEGADREIVEVGGTLTGLNRLEVFIDARDIEDGADLSGRGGQKLAEYPRLLTFDTEILTQGPYGYGEDWDLGDIVTVQNRKWGVTLDSRVTEVTEVYEPGGFRLSATFGSSIPTLPEKLKQEMDQPLVERPEITAGEQGPPGQDGAPGTDGLDGINGQNGADGIGLEYDWQSTSLGVKREDEAAYSYADLRGPQGLKGDKGDTGAQGMQGEQGEQGIQGERGLKGDKGDPGQTGAQGEKGDTGDQGLQGPPGDKGEKGDPGNDGYTPVKGVDYFDGTKGDKGDKGDQGIQGQQGVPGTKGDTGAKGDTGVAGDTWKPAVSTAGDLTWAKDSGSTTPAARNIKGPKGDTGAQGAKGDTGAAGMKGDPGDTWRPAVDANGNLSWTKNSGSTPPGLQNIKGPKGDTGQQGIQGQTGAKGDKGDTGTKGDPGNTWRPTVATNGDLSWAINSGTTQPTTVNIKGPKGDPGSAADAMQIAVGTTEPAGLKTGDWWYKEV